MVQIITINETNSDHLAQVADEMRALGAPTIRCIETAQPGILLALEGSHRLAAAQALGLLPMIAMLSDDDMIDCAEIGYDDMGWFDGEPARAGDIRDRIAQPMGMFPGCPILIFDGVDA